MTSIKQALDKGWKLFQAGELHEAEQVYLQIRKQDPKQVDALHLLGIIAAQTGHASKAIEYFRGALRLKPGWAAAHNNLGNVFVNQKNFSQAVDSYRKAVKAKPDFALAYNNLGNALRECGRLAEAADSISQALRLKPDYPEAHSNLGIVLQAQGKLAEATASFQEAVRLNPNLGEVHVNLGNLLLEQGQKAGTAEHYRQALRLKPDNAEVHNNLGNVLLQLGELEQALGHLQEAIRLNSDFAEAYHSLGIVLKAQGKLPEAVASYQRALQLKPDYAEAYVNLGNAFLEQGQLLEAADYYRRALSCKPDYAQASNNLGNALLEQGNLPEAEARLLEAVRLEPVNAAASYNLGIVLWRQGRLEEAADCYLEALRLKPEYPEAHLNLGNVRKDQGRLDDAIDSYRAAVGQDPTAAHMHSNLILCLHYHPGYDAAAFYDESRRWNQRHAEPLKVLIRPHTNRPEPERRLRIGYVSPDFREHVDSFFTIPLLSNHDHRQFEIFCYANVKRPDSVTQRLRGFADVWRSTVGLSDQQIADMIRADQIDILVDLELHAANNKLLVFARKPAPVQVAWLGYPGTTGLSVIDYRLTDPYLDPPGMFDTFSSEEVVRLPDTFWCYDPGTQEPPVNALPALEAGFITFGCLNTFCKVNDGCLVLWAQVLRAVPNSRLLLRAPAGPTRDRVIAALQREGIAPSRVEFVGKVTRPEYLKLYHRIDVGLDPTPCNGHTTSLDSFWMGVPGLTLVGKTIVGRAGWSQLCNLGLQELAAESAEQFVARAVEWSADLQRLQALRGSLRQRMLKSPLMDGKRFAFYVEQAYRQM